MPGTIGSALKRRSAKRKIARVPLGVLVACTAVIASDAGRASAAAPALRAFLSGRARAASLTRGIGSGIEESEGNKLWGVGGGIEGSGGGKIGVKAVG